MNATTVKRRVDWQAMRRSGVGAVGVLTVTDAERVAWVRSRYQAGDRWLTVVDRTTGEEVGGIVLDDDTDRRIWWA